MKQNKYDMVVIGSGIGGMAAAALLAKKGVKPLVVESKEYIGGRFSTIDEEGFKLPTGAILIHEQGWVPWLLKECGINMELRRVPRLFYRIAGKEYEMPSKGRLRMLLEFLDKGDASTGRIAANFVKEVAAGTILGGMGQAMLKPEALRSITLRDWLMQYTDDKVIHEIFDQICSSSILAHSWEIPASEYFFFMAKSQGMRDLMIAPHGCITIIEELANAIKPVCDIWTGCAARQISITKGKATEVVVEKNGVTQSIPCRAVISDIGPTATANLVGKDDYDGDYRKLMRMKLRPSPCVLILIASDKPLLLEGKSGVMITIGARRLGGIVPLSNIAPELAPAGQHLLYTVAEPLSCLLPMDEDHEKQQCMLDIKEQFPDFEKHGRILRMEPRNVYHEWPEGRTWNGYDMPIETPVTNLFTIGDACKNVGLAGSSGSVESAIRAVKLALRQMKM